MGDFEGLDEAAALVLWCARLPDLRAQAAAGRWTDRLERTVARVREHGRALDACVKFGLVDAGGQPTPIRGPGDAGVTRGYPDPHSGRPPMTGRGDYRCPRRLCSRQDRRDDEGRPPVCALFDDEPMRPR
ncbi:hypothetical protein [Actinokineospora cianjurensis]|uniref:Uncharacterized protein n=1 Tax=Actinokineospora cianjurensis TaxID=585224 RepID=A0A421B357_9PSEU|nr:hypothetical protein [Actinokineospora cianjurensis]RLK58708.1 hypothetical protein CLV68_3183 [Actinokineospora cianjurensis]